LAAGDRRLLTLQGPEISPGALAWGNRAVCRGRCSEPPIRDEEPFRAARSGRFRSMVGRCDRESGI